MLGEKKVAGNRYEQRVGGGSGGLTESCVQEDGGGAGEFCEWDTREHRHIGCQNSCRLGKI